MTKKPDPDVRLEYCFYRGAVTKDNFISLASAAKFVDKYGDGRVGPTLSLRARHKDGRRGALSHSPGPIVSAAHLHAVLATEAVAKWIEFILADDCDNTNYRVVRIAAKEAKQRKGKK